MTSSGTQPSRAVLVAAGVLTQVIGAVSLVLALASLPVAHDLRSGTSGVIASIVAALAAIVCGTLIWRGRLVPLALATGLDVGLGIGLARGGAAVGGIVRMLPADDVALAETIFVAGAVVMFVAAVLCIIAVPSALELRAWARGELAASLASPATAQPMLDDAPTRERPRADRPSASTTLRGVGTAKLLPTQVIRVDAPARHKPLVIAGVAVTLIAIGIVVITAATQRTAPAVVTAGTSGSSTTHAAEPAEAPDPGPAPPAVGPSAPVIAAADAPPAPSPPRVDDFVARFHAALANPAAPELAPLFDARAFAFGVDSHDVAEGRETVVAQLRADLGEAPAKGFEVTARFARVASDGDVGWLAEELRLGGKAFVITAALVLRDGSWQIAALHVAHAMANDTAYRLAREGELAVPDAIPDAHDAAPLATAMRTAVSSLQSFVEARSTRPDAFNFGSAGERLEGGEAIRKVFGRLRASIRLHDAIKVGALGERGGWAVANVDFTDADKDGTEVTQTFRVLAVWLREDAGWRIVQTQWSNAR